ncbi:hypothetical protein IJ21_20100 [Paenibacillus sp. 32O-W]|nr:hypothetical protein IJ21_20100 [Paenibacillus sp. 32O-W]
MLESVCARKKYRTKTGREAVIMLVVYMISFIMLIAMVALLLFVTKKAYSRKWDE